MVYCVGWLGHRDLGVEYITGLLKSKALFSGELWHGICMEYWGEGVAWILHMQSKSQFRGLGVPRFISDIYIRNTASMKNNFAKDPPYLYI